MGVAKLLVRKTLTNYYDGTFCWSGEGKFFAEVRQETGTRFCKFVRGLYYTRDYSQEGKYYVVWSNFQQMIWMTLLFISVFSLCRLEKTTHSDVKDILMLGIIGLTVFELVFEARARYLFTYIPIYIILGMYGIEHLRKIIGRKEESS